MKHKNAILSGWITAGVLAICFLTVLFLYISGPKNNRNGDHLPKKPEVPGDPHQDIPSPEPEELQALRKEALSLQQGQKWCEAKSKWQAINENPHFQEKRFDQAREEAIQNIALLEKLCQPVSPLVPHDAPVPVPEQQDKPDRISETDLLTYYPVGRTTRSLAIFTINGRGTNKTWLLQGEAYFTFAYRVVMESRVTANLNDRIVVEQDIKEVSQTRAVCKREIRLVPPDNPLLLLVWNTFEKQLLSPHPIYQAVRKLADLVGVADPGAKRTLTWFEKQLRRAGLPLDKSEEIELATQLMNLSGLKVRLEYVSGLGVTEITPLEGIELSESDLVRLAHNLSLLADYFIFPAADKKVGDEWEVRAKDVSELGALLDFEIVQGTLRVRLDQNDPTGNDDLRVLSIRRGGITLEQKDEEGAGRNEIVVKSGSLEFSDKQKLVTKARLFFSAKSSFRPRGLLLGTEKIRDLSVESYYEGGRSDLAGPRPNPQP